MGTALAPPISAFTYKGQEVDLGAEGIGGLGTVGMLGPPHLTVLTPILSPSLELPTLPWAQGPPGV